MSLSEFDLIYRYFSAFGRGAAVELSVGDDCALLRLDAGERLATSVDTLVEGSHFPRDAFPEDIGYRCLAVAASDLAAMGARPLGATLALTLPDADELWLHAFSQGIAAAVAEFSLPLVGGDTTRGSLTLGVQALGALPLDAALLRSGARVGDEIYVSGTLGDAAAALAMLEGKWRAAPDHAHYLVERFYRPTPRLALGRELLGTASAAIDVSDGLLADAGHLAAASGVCLRIDPALLPLSAPLREHDDRAAVLRWALTGGDDYELCYCVPPGADAHGGTRIGSVIEGEGVECPLPAGTTPGYDHFDTGDG